MRTGVMCIDKMIKETWVQAHHAQNMLPEDVHKGKRVADRAQVMGKWIIHVH